MCGTAGPCCLLLTVELGHNEGLCGRVNPRSTVWGTRGAPLLTPLLRGPGERGCFALSPSHLSPLQMSGLEHSWRKTPGKAARSCGGEHRAAQKLPCSPATRRLGSASPPSPAMENPAPSTPLPPLGYQTFTAERNLKFSTSLPASTSALGALAPKAQPPPAPCGDAASLPGPPAPGYTVTCCSGSSSTSRCSTSLPFTLLCQETSVTCSQTTRASGTRTKGQQRGDPRAGCRVGFASVSSPSSGPGRQSAVQGGRRSWFAGEWQQDLTRRARQTGRGRTGAEGTAGDESGFSAPVSPLRKA